QRSNVLIGPASGPNAVYQSPTIRCTLHVFSTCGYVGSGALVLVAGLFARRRGRRAKSSLPQVIYGRCFRVFEAYANSGTGQKREQKRSARAGQPVPLYLFVLVGPTKESARWYLLPSDWNDAMPEEDEQVTLEIQPYTDFVIRLNEKRQSQLLASTAPA